MKFRRWLQKPGRKTNMIQMKKNKFLILKFNNLTFVSEVIYF